jgi:hypothetical protein
MAYVSLMGYDVEHYSSKLVYENLFPEIQHINGKGVTDKYTPTKDVEKVTLIDVMRILPYAPRFRKLGGTNNGAWHNGQNTGYNNAPQSEHYTIPVDLIYDEGVAVTKTIADSNPVDLKTIVLTQIVKAAALSINVITFAKQIEGYFRDSFTSTGATAGELAEAVFAGDSTYPAPTAGSYADAFIAANSELTKGIPTLGAFIVPMEERQAFVTPEFDRVVKRQYMNNASEAATKILATGFINPFTNAEGTRIDVRTGLLGLYDGVGLFMFNNVVKRFTLVALGLDPDNDTTGAVALLDKIRAIVVYANGTVRGIVGPSVEANPNPYYGGVYILPKLKVGVEVLDGRSIKMVVDGGWTTTNVDSIVANIAFTPIDGTVVKGPSTGFNDGTTN